MSTQRRANAANEHWIQGAINPAHLGMLHKQLGVSAGDKIPEGKLRSAAKGNTPLARRARLALTLRKLR